jgi:hypothetical protein
VLEINSVVFVGLPTDEPDVDGVPPDSGIVFRGEVVKLESMKSFAEEEVGVADEMVWVDFAGEVRSGEKTTGRLRRIAVGGDECANEEQVILSDAEGRGISAATKERDASQSHTRST